MNRTAMTRSLGVAVACVFVAQVAAALPASAYSFSRSLQQGDTGRDVKALEVRVAGWYPSQNQTTMTVDGRFTAHTTIALKAFQSFYGLAADGVAGTDTYAVMSNMLDPDGSTVNFAWGEFKQNSSPSCSAKANAYAGTFDGGMGSPDRVKRHVRWLMWRLEALRAKGGGHTIGINSGFRSVDYNTCIGGAGGSQHMYGTAADQRMANVTNHSERVLGEASDFSGIGCYSQLTHNHFDIRLENSDLPSSQFWWWPKENGRGQDLDDENKPCWGEGATASLPAPPGSRSMPEVMTRAQVMAFAAAGETANLGTGD
ncbi:MAG: D-Ala-D-Ala carboxypeptidase family metallohydrolase [Actinomycetota bacterium]|nr:D-Ala-D-Ala carboxypeptidase family metallohydrolase [Actinomycetota bacterium]